MRVPLDAARATAVLRRKGQKGIAFGEANSCFRPAAASHTHVQADVKAMAQLEVELDSIQEGAIPPFALSDVANAAPSHRVHKHQLSLLLLG